MFSDIKIHDNWLVHSAGKTVDSVLGSKQEELLETIFSKESISFIKNIVHKKITSLKAEAISQLLIAPFLLLIVKEPSRILTAVSMQDTNQTGGSGEADAGSMEASLIARSPKMLEIMEIVRKISHVDSTILLLGRSGVGKSVIAKLIHKYSSRSNKSFIPVNCGAIPEALMESELFGYSHGSFTGGKRGGKKGIFESANEGTVFLDEIGELPLNLQVKLLEVLQENSIRPIGASRLVPVNVRVIAATNQDLLELVAQKKFREDLYYRLNVVPIEIPSLRERPEDIVYLARHFLTQRVKKYGIYKTFHPDVEEVLKQHEWPGNVRELENLIERVFITAEESEIQVKHLPAAFHSPLSGILPKNEATGIIPLKEAKRLVEKELILKAYDLYKSSYRVAEALGVDQSTIAKKLKEFREEDGKQK
ncbi:sigma-54 interaction domain-containing protein [Brevibacillus fluminis]|uniref:sigma-54 interaction domain-containing protein n=1 Tax=Brevibacillus fluminis TaxID=511487 RepID=UPI003F8A2DD9